MMELNRALHTIRRRWRTLLTLRWSARALSAASLIVATAALAERWLQPSDTAVLVLATTGALLAVACMTLVVWPARRRPDDRAVARFVEESCPDFDDAIVTAVEIQERGGSDSVFAPLVTRSAAARLAAADLARCVDPRDLRHAAARTMAAAVAVALAGVLAAPLAERAIQVAYLRLFPSSISVRVRPGNIRIAAGRPVTISAIVDGRRGTLTRVAAAVTMETSPGQVTTLAMQPGKDGYELRIAALERSFTYKVVAGPAMSSTYSVAALHPSRVQRIELQYEYPAFTGLTPHLELDGGDIYGPAGTRVRMTVHTDKSVAAGQLAFAEGRPAVPLARLNDRTLQSIVTVTEEAAFRVGLVDPDGLASEGIEYFVRVMDDRPPEVHILRPNGDTQITPLEEVPIEARADDDFGIASLDMVFSVSGGAERVVPFTSLGGSSLARVGSRMLAAEDLRVKPGDVIAYYARARDIPRAKQSTLARSEMYFLEVKPFNEEYTLAQSQAQTGAGAAQQLEGLIASQKEIISATWNLERRAGAGKSATDVRNVADAQAELKARAEQAAGAARQRRRFGQQMPQQVAPPRFTPQGGGAPDPVRDAVEAMTRALQHLQTQKTGDAIPHEMAALKALLQAQAEVRRRQVQQQQNNGGGGNGNRLGQDLSNLFDRELKRQQQTNYESKAQVETQPDAAKTETALDRIKDLARRQEELNKRQRELAEAGASAEEMKRQLEKLTRDQEELRRQAEEAVRQMTRSANEPGGTGAESASSANVARGARQELNRALEQMRDAASQGKQDDAAGAAAKGEEAAKQLRKAEAQMQQGSPDAKRRALGDLQLESQQIAEAQRRVAGEAERLDREGGGAADVRRRLAGEKEKLADRLDVLQQSAQRLGAEPGSNAKADSRPGAVAAEAARDLTAQQLSAQMRAGAGRLRDPKGTKTAPAELQLAEALEKIARKINAAGAGGAKGDTAKIADQLDELRAARERLARLEKQIRDAARPGRGETPGRAGRSGQEGQQGQKGSQGEGQGSGDNPGLQQEYNKELQRTRDIIDRAQRGNPESGARMTTPEEHEWSRSAPGTEAFKQDYAAWQSLAADVARALERTEAAVAGRLSNAVARDRLRAGGSERVPDAYRTRVSRYFESIATIRK